jgi:hypothetical protein
MEIWKPCGKYSNYEVSNEARIRNIKTGRIMKTSINKKGYEQVCLYLDNKVCTELVHRLVADAFLEGNGFGMDVRHKNANRQYNYPENLEYCTRKETVKHGFDQGRKSPRQIRVRVIETGEVFDSISECANKFGVHTSNISKCINGVMYSCCGCHFEKVE